MIPRGGTRFARCRRSSPGASGWASAVPTNLDKRNRGDRRRAGSQPEQLAQAGKVGTALVPRAVHHQLGVLAAGYQFRFPELEGALRHVLKT